MKSAGFTSLTDSIIPCISRHGIACRKMICTKPLLSSNVRIKRARRSPEILILHHVCDRWSRVDHRSMASLRLPPNLRRCRRLVWVAPLKFDAVFMRFELLFRWRSSAPHAELHHNTTHASYIGVSLRMLESLSREVGTADS